MRSIPSAGIMKPMPSAPSKDKFLKKIETWYLVVSIFSSIARIDAFKWFYSFSSCFLLNNKITLIKIFWQRIGNNFLLKRREVFLPWLLISFTGTKAIQASNGFKNPHIRKICNKNTRKTSTKTSRRFFPLKLWCLDRKTSQKQARALYTDACAQPSARATSTGRNFLQPVTQLWRAHCETICKQDSWYTTQPYLTFL